MAELTIPRKNPRSPLTASEVKAALTNPPPKGERRILRETGLILRVDDTGVGSWTMERKIVGDQMRRAVGYASEMCLAEARQAVAKVYSDILAGRDPLALRRRRMAGAPRSGRPGARPVQPGCHRSSWPRSAPSSAMRRRAPACGI